MSALARQHVLRFRHSHTNTFKSTHQTSSFHTHIIGANIEAGRPVSDALRLTNIEPIASRSAGQLALLVCANCNTEADGSKINTLRILYVCI